jgi:hypothetical protein
LHRHGQENDTMDTGITTHHGRRARLLAAAVAMLLMGAASGARGAPIAGLFNTGTDAAGNALAGGNGIADPHYTVLSSTIPGVATGVSAATYFNVAYLPDDPNSRWISHTATGFPGSGVTFFRLSFDLTGLDPDTAAINGAWAMDNLGEIYLNGMPTGIISLSGFSFLVPFSITDGFVAGVNTLDFGVFDQDPPLALRVDNLAGTADVLGVPAPASLALLGLAAAALGLRRRAAT